MKKQRQQHHLEGLMALLLFGVFAVCVLAVLLTGADAYRRLTERDAAAYDSRTCIQYIATRVRQADVLGGVSVDEFDGVQCLSLSETIDGESYVTYVYCYDGAIRELFSYAGNDLDPESGEIIMAAKQLQLSLEEDGRLSIRVETGAGDLRQLTLPLRSWEVEQ